MRENGTDRDIALLMLESLSTLKDTISAIENTLWGPHIITQPVDAHGANGTDVQFTVVADNVKAYQWQYKLKQNTTWNNSSSTGNKTATFTIGVTSSRVNWDIRCMITGLDDTVIYTDTVHMTMDSE